MKLSPYAGLVPERTMPASSLARAAPAPAFRSPIGTSQRLVPTYARSRYHHLWKTPSMYRVRLKLIRYFLGQLNPSPQPGLARHSIPTPPPPLSLINRRQTNSIQTKAHSLFQKIICPRQTHRLRLYDGSGYLQMMRLGIVQQCGPSRIPGRIKVSRWTIPALTIKLN